MACITSAGEAVATPSLLRRASQAAMMAGATLAVEEDPPATTAGGRGDPPGKAGRLTDQIT